MHRHSTALVADTGGPRARLADPDTSHVAADGSDLAGSQAVVAVLLRSAGPAGLTDEEIFEGSRSWPVLQLIGHKYSPSRLRTARAELVEAGRVRDAGIFRYTEFARLSKVWALTEFVDEVAS